MDERLKNHAYFFSVIGKAIVAVAVFLFLCYKVVDESPKTWLLVGVATAAIYYSGVLKFFIRFYINHLLLLDYDSFTLQEAPFERGNQAVTDQQSGKNSKMTVKMTD